MRAPVFAAAMSAARLGFMNSGYDFALCQHEPNPNARYTDSGKPLSKRRKRRLRGKGQQ